MGMSLERKDELPQERLQRLHDDPAIKTMLDTTGNLPIWAMAGAAIAYFAQDFAKRTERISPKSPKLVSLGMIIIVAMFELVQRYKCCWSRCRVSGRCVESIPNSQ